MAQFGTYPSNAVMPIAETYVQASPNAVLDASDTLFGLGGFQMPFAGNLYLDLWGEMAWPGENTAPAPEVWLWVSEASSPTPSASPHNGWCQAVAGVFGGQQELRTFGIWYSLAAGQQVTAYAQIYTTILGTVLVQHVGGFWRPTAT
jgi:hypothetical protein